MLQTPEKAGNRWSGQIPLLEATWEVQDKQTDVKGQI